MTENTLSVVGARGFSTLEPRSKTEHIYYCPRFMNGQDDSKCFK